MSSVEFNVRYKVNIGGMDLHDPNMLTMQYSFIPDSFRDSTSRMTTNGDNAVLTTYKSNDGGEGASTTLATDVVLKGSMQSLPNDSVLLFDAKANEFRLVNSGVAINGLKRDREDKFHGTDGTALTRADVSKRLKQMSRAKRKAVPATTAVHPKCETGVVTSVDTPKESHGGTDCSG